MYFYEVEGSFRRGRGARTLLKKAREYTFQMGNKESSSPRLKHAYSLPRFSLEISLSTEVPFACWSVLDYRELRPGLPDVWFAVH